MNNTTVFPPEKIKRHITKNDFKKQIYWIITDLKRQIAKFKDGVKVTSEDGKTSFVFWWHGQLVLYGKYKKKDITPTAKDTIDTIPDQSLDIITDFSKIFSGNYVIDPL